MRHRINLEALLRITFLCGIAAFLFIALITGKIQNYVHPRLNVFLWISFFLLLGIGFFMLPEFFIPKHNVKIGKYVIFVIPMCAAVLIPIGTLQNKAVSFDTLTPLSKTAAQKEIEIPDKIPSQDDIGIDVSSSSPDTAQAHQKYSDSETISDEQFADWYTELNKNMKQYEGKTFRFKGQVFRMSNFAKNEFVPARYAMVCCAADLQPCGVLCRSDEAKNLKDDDWVWVTGKLQIEQYQGQTMPVCYATKIEKATPAKQEYIYFTY